MKVNEQNYVEEAERTILELKNDRRLSSGFIEKPHSQIFDP